MIFILVALPFYGHSPPFRWFIQEGLLSVTSESMCKKLLVNRLFKPAQEKVWLGELTVPQWPKLLTWDVKQQNKQVASDEPALIRGSISKMKMDIQKK